MSDSCLYSLILVCWAHMNIEPNIGVVLVKLAAGNFGGLPIPDKYDSITSGTIIAIAEKDNHTFKIGDIEFHRLFKDDCRIDGPNDEKFALIEVKDILGKKYEKD